MSNETESKSESWVVAIVFAGGFALMMVLFVLIGNYVLAPLFAAANVYFVNYGRMTAEVFTVIALVALGLWFHEKIVRNMVKNFCEHAEKLDQTIETVTKQSTELNRELEKLELKIRDQERIEDHLKQKIALLKNETVSLQTEIERLQNPEEVERKEQVAAQKQNDQNLKSIAESIRWGRT